MSGNISNYTVSPKVNNRVCVSACGQGNIDSQQQFCVSTYTSGDASDVGFCIQATTTPPLDTSTSIQKLLLWLDSLTTNCPFTLTSPSLTLTSPYTSINGSIRNKIFTYTTSPYTIPDAHQGNYLISNTTSENSSITLPLITSLDDGYTLTIRNVGSPIRTSTLNCSGTNLITLSSLANASHTFPLVSSIQLLAFSNGAISYWLVI